MLFVALNDSFGWGRGVTAGAIAVGAVAWGVSAPLWGALYDRWGPRRVWTTAAVIGGLGLAVAAGTREPWQLYLGVGLLNGLVLSPFAPNCQGVVVSRWFVRRRGVAMAIMAAGVGVGVLALAPLTQLVLSALGWRAAFLGLAALFAFLVAPLNALLQRGRPQDVGLAPDGASVAPAPSAAGPSVGQALRQRRFWALLLGIGLGVIPIQLLLVHGVAHLVDVGFSRQTAAAALGLSGACAVGGMLLWGYVADRWNAEWAYSAGSLALVGSIGLLFVLRPGQDGLLVLYAVLLALGLASRIGGIVGFIGAALCQGRSLGALMGILSAQIAVGSAIGPALGGWTYDPTGSYHLALLLAAICAGAAAGGVWLAAPRRGVLAAPAPR